MSTALELVFRYRQLVGTCEGGAGLTFDDIEVVSTIEALFAVEAEERGSRRWRDRPQLGSETVEISALLRGPKVCDQVAVVALGPEGLTCVDAPYMNEGDAYEIVIDDAELSVSYRFMGRVMSLDDDDNGDLAAQLSFTGVPVLVRYGETATRPGSQDGTVRAEGTPRPEKLKVGASAA